MSTISPQPHETILHTYAPGCVVQVLSGDVRMPGADVVSLEPASIRISATRVSALVGEKEFSWPLDKLEDVAHGVDGTWTILSIPDARDFGVAPKPEDVASFRNELENARMALIASREIDEAVESHAAQEQEEPPALEPEPKRIHQRFDGWSGASLTEHLDVPTVEVPVAVEVAEAMMPSALPVYTPSADVATEGLASLDARSISAWFGDHHVLDRISLHMAAGKVTALIGPSGCGKSTFLRILNRMHEMIPSASLAGEVLLDSQDIYDVSRKLTDARRQIGMVFQKPNPFPAMSIYDNVVASLRLTGTKASTDEKDEIVETCLTKAGLWTEVRDRLRQPGGGLSGGQQQRLCIARALAIRPRVLLMDEPCSTLDPTSTRRIEQTIVELKSEVTIVIVTHNMQQANRVSDECAFFLAEAGTPGVIVEHGDTEAMFHNPQDERTHAYVNGRFG